MLHMNLRCRNVFRFWGLELDQLLQVTRAQSRSFWCQTISEQFGPFHVLKAEFSRDHVCPQNGDTSDVSELLLAVQSAQLESEETGRD